MEFSVEFGGDVQDLTIVLSGIADPAGLNRLNDELRADPRFRPGLAILADITDLDSRTIGPENADAVVEPVAERDWETPPLAIAIVAGGADNLEQAERWRAYLGGSKSRRKVFSERTSALEWLRGQKTRA